MANFSQFSRYKNGVATSNDDADLFIINRDRIVLPESEEDTFFLIEGQHIRRPDLIANEIYGNAELWWVIADVNNIRNPITDFTANKLLRIPPLDLVLIALESTGQ